MSTNIFFGGFCLFVCLKTNYPNITQMSSTLCGKAPYLKKKALHCGETVSLTVTLQLDQVIRNGPLQLSIIIHT